MATVYKAFDTRLEADVAVKVIRTDNLAPNVLDRVRKRFDREAKALAKLTHPNIVKVTDYGEHEGVPYLVMPHLPGGTLKERIKRGRTPWREAVSLLAPIARALEYAHKQKIVHRDIKPSNVLITETGAPMLSDFGVAKVLSDSDETHELTGTGMGVGTPEYMAPEQFQGRADSRVDIYALGVVLYEMVTGRKPYLAETPAAVIIKQATEPLPRPTRFAPDLPASIEKILIKSLAKSPKDRYQSMGEFALALERLILVGEKENKKQEERQKKSELQKKKRQEKEERKREEQKQNKALKEKKKVEKVAQQKQQKAKQAERLKKKEEASVPHPRVPVLRLIFGIVGLGIIYGVVNWIGSLRMAQPPSTPTIISTSVPISTTSTSSPEASSTPQNTSTPLMTPTPSPTAMPDGWLYFDDFEGEKRRYVVQTVGLESTKYGTKQYEENHVYYIDTGARHMTMELFDLINMARDGVIFSNYAFEFDMMFPERLPRYSTFKVHLRSSQRGDQNFSTRYVCSIQFYNFKQISISYLSPTNSEKISDNLPKSFQSNTWYRHRFEVKGEKIKWFINGALQLQTQDSKISSGLPVISIGGHSPDNEGNGGLFYFDNILVESLK